MRRRNLIRLMNCCWYFLALSLGAFAVVQDKQRRIGEIDFYGYAGLDLNRIRSALPLREGDELSDSDDGVLEAIGRIRETVQRVLGKPPTDVAAVCCDAQGNAMFYIGLPGNSIRNVPYRSTPLGRARLPARGEISSSKMDDFEQKKKKGNFGSDGYPSAVPRGYMGFLECANEFAFQFPWRRKRVGELPLKGMPAFKAPGFLCNA